MSFTITREMERLEGDEFSGLDWLGIAFVGLFGTVWGIMNSFQSIAESRIPAWLSWPWYCRGAVATALGLAAIPAVIAQQIRR